MPIRLSFLKQETKWFSRGPLRFSACNIVAAEPFLIASKIETRHPGITPFPALLTMGWLSRIYGWKGRVVVMASRRALFQLETRFLI